MLTEILEYFDGVETFVPIIRTIIFVVILYITFKIILSNIKKRLLNRAKTKRQTSNVEIFSRILKYIFLLIIVLVALFSYGGSLTGLGIGLGLFSAALGWALQKPITGVAAWIMVVTRRPFEIGDRIIIGNVKGDVVDISLTHIYINEVGGIVAGEENSGRTVMIPNSILFEQNIINYTSENEYVLHQVQSTFTYEGNLDKAMNIMLDSANKYVKEFSIQAKEKSYVRVHFQANGVDVVVRYFVPVKRLHEIASKVTKEIYDRVKKEKDVEFAYPHTEILLKKK